MTQTAAPFMPGRTRPAVPPLQNGDNLSAEEFERRYDAMPPGTRAELIEGVVFVFPPLSHGWHGLPHADLITLLGVYRADTPGVTGGENSSLRLDTGNMPQPDTYLLVAPAYGGRARLDDDLYILGAPEFVAEVTATSANYDLHQKLETYRRNEVAEYVVWRTVEGQFDQFTLTAGQFQRQPTPVDGIVRSTAFPGLWLDTASLNAGRLSAALAVVHRGLASPEYAAFVADLHRRRAAAGT